MSESDVAMSESAFMSEDELEVWARTVVMIRAPMWPVAEAVVRLCERARVREEG